MNGATIYLRIDRCADFTAQYYNHQRHLNSRHVFKQTPNASLTEWVNFVRRRNLLVRNFELVKVPLTTLN
jgi:hypothetical protein